MSLVVIRLLRNKVKENSIERYLRRQHKCLIYKWTSPGVRGVPDDIAIWPGGRIDFLELKTETGKLSKLQVYQLNRLTDQGCRCYVLSGKTDVDLYLMGLKEPWTHSDLHK